MDRAMVVLIMGIAVAGCISQADQGEVDTDAFAKCLTEKGISMAGTEWCPHCRNQKEKFGDSFIYVDYHDCDTEVEWCRDKGVRAYPTWVLSDGRLDSGTKSLKKLSKLSGCELS